MFLSVALEAGVFEPHDSELGPVSVMRSAVCCGLPHRAKPLGVQAMARARWFPSAACPPTLEDFTLAEPSHRKLRPMLGPDDRLRGHPSARKSSPVARREPVRVMMERRGDDLHRRPVGCCKRVDHGVAPAVARLSSAIHGFLQEPTATDFHETLSRDHCDLARSGSGEEGHPHNVPGNESVRDEASDRICLEHLIGGPAYIVTRVGIDLGTPVHGLKGRQATSRAPDSVMTVAKAKPCACCTLLTALSSTPVFAPKMRCFTDKDWLQITDSVMGLPRYPSGAPHGATTCTGP